MVRRILFFSALALLIGLGCSKQPTDLSEGMNETSGVEQAMAEVDAKAAEIVNLMVRAGFTGDVSELKAYVDHDDPDGVLRRLLDENGIDLEVPVLKGTTEESVGLPVFTPENSFEDGTVLLSKTLGTPTGDLLNWVFNLEYSHCGMLDIEVYEEDPNKGCIITANTEDGLTYETYDDWDIIPVGATKKVTAMNVTDRPSWWDKRLWWGGNPLDNAQSTIYNIYQGCPYSFFWLNLEPVPRWGPVFWYCSKTTWRIFIKLLLNVENPTWHGINLNVEGVWTDPDKYEECTSSGLYQLLVALYSLCPDIEDPVWEADKKTWRNLKELITPDEIRHHSALAVFWESE